MRIKRVYDTPSKEDGCRILVDRLWPRGLSKENAKLDLWLKEIGPSDDLRKWFAHDPSKWEEFKKRYAEELEARKELIQEIEQVAKKGQVTLLYSAKDTEHNNALALKAILEKKSSK